MRFRLVLEVCEICLNWASNSAKDTTILFKLWMNNFINMQYIHNTAKKLFYKIRNYEL